MQSTGLLETLLITQCTQFHMDSASAEKGRLLAHTLQRRRDCKQPPCTSKLTTLKAVCPRPRDNPVNAESRLVILLRKKELHASHLPP